MMAIILQYPKHEVMLRQKSVKVVKATRELIDDMAEYQGKCLGLAAVQLGVPVRLIMVKWGEDYIFLANPEIVKVSSQTYLFSEACLSIENGNKIVIFHRPKRIKVRYTDVKDNQRILKAEGLTARILQHEIDHLEGKLIIDYAVVK